MYNFTLKQLEILKAVIEGGSFTEASARLYLSQSTISTHVAELERVLDMRLFDRTAKKQTVPTTAGWEVYRFAKDILDACEKLETRSRIVCARHLAIGASHVPADHLLPDYLARFMSLYPGCTYEIKRGDSSEIHEMLVRNEIRLGLVGTALDKRSLRYIELAKDTMVVITPATERFRLLQKKDVTGRELLKSEPLIFREQWVGEQQTAAGYVRKHLVEDAATRTVLRMDSPEGIMNAVASGIGVSIVSSLASRSRERMGSILCFPLDAPPVYRGIYLAVSRSETLTPAEADFVRMVTTEEK